MLGRVTHAEVVGMENIHTGVRGNRDIYVDFIGRRAAYVGVCW